VHALRLNAALALRRGRIRDIIRWRCICVCYRRGIIFHRFDDNLAFLFHHILGVSLSAVLTNGLVIRCFF